MSGSPRSRLGAHAIVRGRVACIHEPLHSLLGEVPRVRARLSRLRQFDLLAPRHR